MNPTRVYLIRHGQVQGHEQKRYNGQSEVALTEKGRAQFGMLQMRLQERAIKAVYTSDLGRCVEGARILGHAHGLEPLIKPALRELHVGEWEGRTWQELQASYPQQWQNRLDDLVHYRVPGGENLLDLAQRVRPALEDILRAHPGEEVVIVGHGGVNRLILLDAIGAPLDKMFHLAQDFGCLNIIDYHPDGLRVVSLLNG